MCQIIFFLTISVLDDVKQNVSNLLASCFKILIIYVISIAINYFSTAQFKIFANFLPFHTYFKRIATVVNNGITNHIKTHFISISGGIIQIHDRDVT